MSLIQTPFLRIPLLQAFFSPVSTFESTKVKNDLETRVLAIGPIVHSCFFKNIKRYTNTTSMLSILACLGML
ncbi:hypothetical protein F4775DRAFT_551792 [Biscogniauxia sp. FL1348]|nr:hypothetical protein F4775DRAFT_551792 [Biscogniauxia sp. FL1348]